MPGKGGRERLGSQEGNSLPGGDLKLDHFTVHVVMSYICEHLDRAAYTYITLASS